MSLVSMPSAPAGTLAQQVQQQYAYLFQLAQTLNLSLQALEGSGGAAFPLLRDPAGSRAAVPPRPGRETLRLKAFPRRERRHVSGQDMKA